MRDREWRRHHRERLIRSRERIMREVWHEDPDGWFMAGKVTDGEAAMHEFATRWATSRRTLCSCPMCKWNRSVPPWGREPTMQERRSDWDWREWDIDRLPDSE